MMATEIVVDIDPIGRAEIIEQITLCNHAAKREFAKVGTVLRPTGWDVRHRRLNYLLDELEAADG